MVQIKKFIKNKNQEKICILIDKPRHPKGIAIIMHGLGVTKEWVTIANSTKLFLKSGFIVVRFDARDTFGESEGKYEDATVSSYLQDLTDVVRWSKGQSWFRKPMILVGHSIGGLCVVKYATRRPKDIASIITLSTVISGKLTMQSPEYRDWREWKKKGWRERRDANGVLKRRIRWNHYANRLRFDLLKDAKKIKAPMLMISGSKDKITPAADNKLLYDRLQVKKEFHTIKGAEHDIKEPAQIVKINKIMRHWTVDILRNYK